MAKDGLKARLSDEKKEAPKTDSGAGYWGDFGHYSHIDSKPINSSTVEQAVKDLPGLSEDLRYVLASKVLRQAKDAIVKDASAPGAKAATALLETPDIKKVAEQIDERASACDKAYGEFQNDEGWNYAQELAGITTYYKTEEGAAGLTVKIEGTVEDCHVLDVIGVIREGDLHKRWIPFCGSSVVHDEPGKAELVVQSTLNVPLLKRDFVLHAYGVNVIENGVIMILGKSVDDWPGVTIPPVTGWGADRAEFAGFKALVEPLTPTSARICMIANIDLKVSLPQSMINFLMKKVAGVLVLFLQKEAKKVRKEGDKNIYVQRMKEDKLGFYKFLRPRITDYFSTLGFNLDEDEDSADNRHAARMSVARKSVIAGFGGPHGPPAKPGPVGKVKDMVYSTKVWPFLYLLPFYGYLLLDNPGFIEGTAVLLPAFFISAIGIWHHGTESMTLPLYRHDPRYNMSATRFLGSVVVFLLAAVYSGFALISARVVSTRYTYPQCYASGYWIEDVASGCSTDLFNSTVLHIAGAFFITFCAIFATVFTGVGILNGDGVNTKKDDDDE